MAKTYDLLIRARGETRDAERAMRQLQRRVANFGTSVRNIGAGLTAAVTLPVVAMAGIGIRELGQMQTVNAQTFAALKSTGGAAGLTAGQIQKMATNLSSLTGIDDQVVQSGANILLTFKKIGGKDGVFARATTAALDLSVAFGKDMTVTSLMVGKALQNPIKGVTALTRAGVDFTDAQRKTIARLVETGDVAGAQKLILKELEDQIGGSARAFGDTAPGKIGKLKERFAGLSADMVTRLIPAFEKLAGWLERGMTWFDGLDEKTKTWIGTGLVLGAILGPIVFAVGGLIAGIAALIPVIVGLGAPVLAAIAVGTVFWGVLGTLYAKSETFRGGVNALIDALMDNKQWFLALLGPGMAVVALLISMYHGAKNLAGIIMGAVRSALGWVRENAAGAWTFVNVMNDRARDFAVGLGGALSGAVKSGHDWIRDRAAACWTAVNNAIGDARGFAAGLGSALVGSVKNGIEWVRDHGASAWSAMKAAVDGVKSVVQTIASAISTIKSGLDSIASKIRSLPDMPNVPGVKFMARGGITKGISIAGEAGPEAVIPLGWGSQQVADRNRVMGEMAALGYGAGGGGATINVYTTADPESVAQRVASILGSRRMQTGGAF